MLSEIIQTQKDEYCDSTHGRSLEKSDPQRQEVDGKDRGWGRGWRVSIPWGQSLSLGRRESSGDGPWEWLHNNVNVLNVTELCS